MIPIVFHGRDKVILIGDHCQLGPVVMDEAAARQVPDHVYSMYCTGILLLLVSLICCMKLQCLGLVFRHLYLNV